MSGVGPRTAPTYNAPAPSNYVAGVGRGAMGFTTRSDIGPARPAAGVVVPSPDAQFGQPPPGYVAGRGRGMGDLARTQQGGAAPAPVGDVDRMDYSESNYDEFAGYGERLFSSSAYDDDDLEADHIYQNVDEAMEARRKRARERQLLQDQKKARADRPRIADQFADLKRDLASVTADQWDAIPEVGDHTLKYKQSRKKEGYTPVPDSILLLGSGSGLQRSVDANEGTATALSSGRNVAMTSRLDRISDSVEGQTVVDPKGYLTSLNSIKITSEAEIGDIKKARVLLQSVTTTNPSHGPGWIAAARVEEYANKMVAARKVILEGCEKAPQSEDVWLEAARMHPQDKAKIILNNALKALPQSVKIYLQLSSYELNTVVKKTILRRGLENVPNSVTLWKAAIELENVNDAKILLTRAIECLPTCLDMYIALAKLETHPNARKILNLAREHIPTERKVWIYAATLEEANHNDHIVPKIVEKMVTSLDQLQVITKREEWLAEAIEAEENGYPRTCAEIVKHTIFVGLDKEDYKKALMDDVNTCAYVHQPPALCTARAIVEVLISTFPSKKSVWLQAIVVEKDLGSKDTYKQRMATACAAVPLAEVIWLMYAKETWTGGDVNGARTILMQAYQSNPLSEQIYLAAIKLEWENGEVDRTRMLLRRAEEVIGTARIFMKHALFEWEQQAFDVCLAVLEEGLKKFPAFEKLHLMLGQLHEETFKDLSKARVAFQHGIKQCGQCVALWRALILLEERDKGLIKARSIGEMARLKCPQNEHIYLICMDLEMRNKMDKLYGNLLAKALQECPTSGPLFAYMLLHVPKAMYKAKAIEGLKKAPHSDVLLLALARIFERVYVYRKSYKYYERALTINPRLGDAYVYYFACVYIQIHKHALLERQVRGGADYAEALQASGETSEDMVGMEGVDEEDEPPKEQAGVAEDAANSAGGAAPSDKEALLYELLTRCEEHNPNHGEVWNAFTKQMAVRRKTVKEKLVLAVQRVLGFNLLPGTCGYLG